MVLTPEQRRIVDHPLTPLLVVAGAGTGKTTVMAARMAEIIRSGQAGPDQLLGLTFTNKASAELARRVRLATGVADVTVSTYHGFAAGLVAAHGRQLGLPSDVRLLGKAEAWQLLFAVFDEFRFEKRSAFAPGVVVDAALKLASRCADQLVTADDVEADCDRIIDANRWEKGTEAAKGRKELCQVVRAYDRRKRELGLIDWGDQIRLAVHLLSDDAGLCRRLHEEHPVVLLDEYQDTNYAQRVMLSRIYPAGSAITAVGDDMQSIYAFRGAHLENILDFEKQWAAAVLSLTECRRSGPELVELANRAQRMVKGRTLPKVLRPQPDAPTTVVECFLATDDAEEAATIAADLAAVGPPWAESAVLCRKRRIIPAIAAALEDAGIPVEVVGVSGLLARPEIVDVVAWLEVLAEVDTGVPLVRLLQGPRYQIGMRDLAALARHARSLDEALSDLDAVADLSDDAGSRLAGFNRDRMGLAEQTTDRLVVDAVESVISVTGLWGLVGSKGRENLLRFLDLAHQYSMNNPDQGLVGFVEYLQLIEEAEEDVAEAHLSGADAVRVMTIHQAKGLEFGNVWVPGLAKSVFPDERTGENPVGWQHALPWWVGDDDTGLPTIYDPAVSQKDVEDAVRSRHRDEEWRLFYVACTRAQRRLVLSAAHWYAGASKPQGASDLFGFVLAQDSLVQQRFLHQPGEVDPQVALMERRRRLVTSPERV